MKKVLLLLMITMTVAGFSQTINDYQYVIVPAKYDIFKEKENDKYRLNTITKLLLQKYGFKSFLSTEDLPKEIGNDRCGVLYATLEEDNGVFATKIKLILKDCKENILYETAFGSSREKEYAVAYNKALREAFKSFDQLGYKFSGTTITTPEVSDNPAVAAAPSPNATENNPEIFFFAQPITNGFQIVDSEPRVIMRLFNTSQKNVFIGVKGDTHGVVIMKNGQWFFEYYESGKFVSESLKLRF